MSSVLCGKRSSYVVIKSGGEGVRFIDGNIALHQRWKMDVVSAAVYKQPKKETKQKVQYEGNPCSLSFVASYRFFMLSIG